VSEGMIDKVKAEPIIDPKRFEKAELSQAFLKNELERCQRHTKNHSTYPKTRSAIPK